MRAESLIYAKDSARKAVLQTIFMLDGLLERYCLLRPELKLSVFMLFGFRQNQAARHTPHVLKNALAYFIDRFCAVNHAPG